MPCGRGTYSPFKAIEINDCPDEIIQLLCKIHGKDLTFPSEEDDKLITEYLNYIYDFSEEEVKPRYKFVIYTDIIKTEENLGPYDKVFHVMY